jgi:hypothetical protein
MLVVLSHAVTLEEPTMNGTPHPATRHASHRTAVVAVAAAVFLLLVAGSAFAQIPLGAAGSYSVLGGSTVTNTGPTTVTGNLGVSPGSAVTGFPPGVVVSGSIHAADASAAQAQASVTTAYNTAAGLPCTTNLTGQDLGGLVLTPGVYCFNSSAQLTGTLTLDAQGSSTAFFLFQIGSTLTTASASQVMVINAPPANCDDNIFWQVGSSATLGTGTSFQGNILALTSITLTTAATVNGRTLARNGAVTLDSNLVGACVLAPAVLAPVGGPFLSGASLLLLGAIIAAFALFSLRR